MNYTNLGKTDIKVSRLCLGCMGFGEPDSQHPWTIDENSAEKIIKKALESGINFFDTAMGYSHGTSEQYVGAIIKRLAQRHEVVVATKFLPRSKEEIASGVSGQKHVENCLDASLSRLGMDYVDLYICHMWDYHTPIEQIMEGLNNAVKAGKARAIGISNCYAWQLEKANAIADRNGWAKFISVQGHYNLIFREEEREMIPCCQEEGIALTPYSPLAGGRLVRDTSTRRSELDEIGKMKYGSTHTQDEIIIKRAAEIAEKRGLTKTQVALGWLLTKVTSPVVGATKISHIEQAVDAVDVKLTQEEIAYLEEPYIPHKLVGVMQFNH